ncbi:MAG: hemerythrin domain-containing protein [Streptosporangiaceae bacterium]
MTISSLAVALEREHHQIDDGVAAFAAAPGDRQPLARTIGALRRHIYLEEEFLFPLLHKAEPGLAAPVFVMLREHAQIWATLDSLERELDAGTGTGTGLALCRQLAVRLLHHNLKEETILYPRADDALSPAAAEWLRTFLGSGDLPEGWVCLMKARSAPQSPGRAGR